MNTLTATKVKSVSGTSLLVATMAMLAAGGALAVLTAPALRKNISTISPNPPLPDPNPPTHVQAQIRSLSAGMNHACLVKKDATVWCWGNNESGQLGAILPQQKKFSQDPIQVVKDQNNQPLKKISAVTAGSYFTCALKNDKTVWCWGNNSKLTLGLINYNGGPVPVQVLTLNNKPLQNITTLAKTTAYSHHLCAIKNDNTIWCWGQNSLGELGNPGPSGLARPVLQDEKGGLFADATQVYTGLNHTCAIKKDNTVWCWGSNIFTSPFDNFDQPIIYPTKILAANQANFKAAKLSMEYEVTYALTPTGEVWYWGDCPGPMNILIHTVPSCSKVAAPFLDNKNNKINNVAGLSSSNYNTCALKNDGTAWCWGNNESGSLGNGSFNRKLPDDLYTPRPVVKPDQTKFDEINFITGGSNLTCALKSNWSIWCWGQDALSLGNPNPRIDDHQFDSPTPNQVNY